MITAERRERNRSLAVSAVQGVVVDQSECAQESGCNCTILTTKEGFVLQIRLWTAAFPQAGSAALLAPRMVLNMYEQRFGLHRKPFQTVTKEQDFFASTSFGELFPGIVHALQTDLGVAVLTGPAGVGKSVSLEQIQRHLDSRVQTLLLRGGSLKGSADLLYLLHRRLLKIQPEKGSDFRESEIGRRYEVVERLERVASFWGPLTILLDDAHLLCADVFAELRSLLEEGHDGQRFARLLIAGPLLLEEVLADSENRHFARKIRTHGFLQPLRSDESIQYLKHLFELAGGEISSAFEASALELIAAAADGIPQCLNLLADESLMVCEENDDNVVTRSVVTSALSRLQHLPYSWNVSMVSEDDDDDDFDQAEEGSVEGSVIVDNAIEFGAFPSDSSSVPSSGAVATDGVIEIGGSISATDASPSAASPSAASTVAASTAAALAVVESTGAESSVFEIGGDVADTCESLEADDLEVGGVEVGGLEVGGLTAVELEAVALETDVSDDVRDVENELVESRREDCIEISAQPFAALGDFSVADQHSAPSEPFSGLHDAQTEVNSLAEFVDEEVDAEQSEVAECSAVSDAIRNFEPWAPAGQWPVEPVLNSPGQPSGDDRNDDQNAAHWDHTENVSDGVEALTEACSVGQAFDDPAVETDLTGSVIDDVATPVLDRFTLAEFGREADFSAFESLNSGDDLFQEPPVFNSAPAWPPTVSGLAPLSQIPVSGLDDDYAELLSDLGLLIDATAERSHGVGEADCAESNFSSAEGVPSERYGEFLAGVKGPEGTIAELQHLIQEEQKWDESNTDSVADSVASPDAEPSIGAAKMLKSDAGSDATPDAENAPAAQSETEAPIETESEGAEDGSSVPHASPRFFSMNQTGEDSEVMGPPGSGTQPSGDPPGMSSDVGTNSPDGHDPDVVAFQQVMEERDEWHEQQILLAEIEDQDQAQQESVPAVLRRARQSRQRVLSVGLKQAAGAETVSDSSAAGSPDGGSPDGAETDQGLANSNDPDGPISLLMPEASQTANDVQDVSAVEDGVDAAMPGEEDVEGSGFANLFTRLRRRRGKAS